MNLRKIIADAHENHDAYLLSIRLSNGTTSTYLPFMDLAKDMMTLNSDTLGEVYNDLAEVAAMEVHPG